MAKVRPVSNAAKAPLGIKSSYVNVVFLEALSVHIDF